LLKLRALSLSDISFDNLINKKISFSNNATDSNSINYIFLSADSINNSVNNKFINAINSFASNSDGKGSSNIDAAIAINNNRARLITSGSNAINSGGKKGLIKGENVA
jgi:hypothetical protein